jgi:hypothetical protein
VGKIITGGVVFAICAWVLVQASLAFNCNGRNVARGDWQADVLYKCGEPSWRGEPWEAVVQKGRVQGKDFSAVQVSVWIEEWVYNSGPTRFMRYLRFENSRLVDFRTGGYGY